MSSNLANQIDKMLDDAEALTPYKRKETGTFASGFLRAKKLDDETNSDRSFRRIQYQMLSDVADSIDSGAGGDRTTYYTAQVLFTISYHTDNATDLVNIVTRDKSQLIGTWSNPANRYNSQIQNVINAGSNFRAQRDKGYFLDITMTISYKEAL